jgi:hypothetical protein
MQIKKWRPIKNSKIQYLSTFSTLTPLCWVSWANSLAISWVDRVTRYPVPKVRKPLSQNTFKDYETMWNSSDKLACPTWYINIRTGCLVSGSGEKQDNHFTTWQDQYFPYKHYHRNHKSDSKSCTRTLKLNNLHTSWGVKGTKKCKSNLHRTSLCNNVHNF